MSRQSASARTTAGARTTAAQRRVPRLLNFSLVFPGSGNNYLLVPSPSVATCTLCFWYKKATPKGTQYVMDARTGGSGTGCFFNIADYSLTAGRGGGGGAYFDGVNTASIPSIAGWHHYATTGSTFLTTGSITFGENSSHTVFAFQGAISDIRLYTGTLSTAQVQQVYYGTAEPAGLIGHWLLNDGSGTAPADTSGNGLTGSIVGALAWSNDGPSALRSAA